MVSPLPPGMPTFLDRLRHRKLVQWAMAYLAGAWLVLQLADVIGDRFGWPDAALRGLTVLLGVGLLAAVVLAWFHGEKGEQRVSGIELLMLGGILVLAGAAVTLVNAPATGGDDAPMAAEAAPQGASVVVLPFLDLSPDKDQEHFSDGLTEEILNALVRIPELRVPARTTSFAFKGRNLPVTQIAAELGVAHVLEGSVRKDGDRLRITAQLIDARSDRHLWSETFDRGLSDVFAVQEQIARAVVDALEVRLTGDRGDGEAGGAGPEPSGAAELVTTGTTDPDAYELYLRGLHAWNRRGPDQLEAAGDFFMRAVQRDPAFARAWTGAALTWVLIPLYGEVPVAEWAARGREAARRALAIDPGLAEARTALASALVLEWELDAAEEEFQRALQLNPSYATARQWYSNLLNATGRPEEGLREIEHARSLDPLSYIVNGTLADQLFYLRRFEESLGSYRIALELQPDASFYEAQYAMTLLRTGRVDEAREAAEAVLPRLGPAASLDRGLAGYVLARSGRMDLARGIAAELEARADTSLVWPVSRAFVHMGLDDHARALALVEEGVTVLDPNGMYSLPTDPAFDPIRGDPRFQRVLDRLRGGGPTESGGTGHTR